MLGLFLRTARAVLSHAGGPTRRLASSKAAPAATASSTSMLCEVGAQTACRPQCVLAGSVLGAAVSAATVFFYQSRPHSLLVPVGSSVGPAAPLPRDHVEVLLTEAANTLALRESQAMHAAQASWWTWLSSSLVGRFFTSVAQCFGIVVRAIQLSAMFGPMAALAPFAYLNWFSTDRWWRWLVLLCEMAGPVFTKLGQWVATRPDLFPPLAVTHFSRLHSRTKPHSFDHTLAVLRRAFGSDLERIFARIDPECVGSGAVAQVHVGYVAALNGGPPTKVALKVLHPGLDVTCERDLFLLHTAAWILELFPGVQYWSPVDSVECFSQLIREQNELTREGQNLIRFRRNFANSKGIIFPSPYFISTELLIESFERGFPVSLIFPPPTTSTASACTSEPSSASSSTSSSASFSTPALACSAATPVTTSAATSITTPAPPLAVTTSGPAPVSSKHTQPSAPNTLLADGTDDDVCRLHVIAQDPHRIVALRKEIAAMGLAAFLKMMITDNFVHGDLHPGNILVRLDENFRPELVFLDVGIASELAPRDRRNLLGLFSGIGRGDGVVVGQLMLEGARQQKCEDPVAFVRQIDQILRKNLVRPTSNVGAAMLQLGTMDVGRVLADVLETLRRHRVKLEANFTAFIVSITVLEGLGRTLDPELDLLRDEYVLPEFCSWRGYDLLEFCSWRGYDLLEFCSWRGYDLPSAFPLLASLSPTEFAVLRDPTLCTVARSPEDLPAVVVPAASPA